MSGDEAPLLVIAPSERRFRDWCWEQGRAPGTAVYLSSPADLADATRCRAHRKPEVVIVDLMDCGGCPWEAALRAVAMDRDGLITLRPGQTEAAKERLSSLIEAAGKRLPWQGHPWWGMMGAVTVTYRPTSGVCVRAFPGYRGAPVRRDALDLHASCTGLYDGIGPVGPYEPGCPCMCECHTPEGLPDWMRPQEGAALEEALAKEARIQARTRHLESAHPVLGPGSLADVMGSLRETCPECGGGS